MAVLTASAEVDVALRDHQVTKSTVAELLKMTGNEGNQIISLLKDQVSKFKLKVAKESVRIFVS